MRTILIVEDEEFIRQLYVLVFKKSDYNVVEAADGQEAIDKALGTVMDMILLDIMLPKVNGLEVLKKVRESDTPAKETPVYLITNLGQEDIMKQAFQLGANGYLVKAQVNPSDIVNEVNKFFTKREETRPA